jgi:hypothetical protein
MGYDERWSNVVGKCLGNTNIANRFHRTSQQPNEARRRIKRAISYYEREGEPFKFIINFMWGGVVIGCLPDPSFQSALLTFSPLEIFNSNHFGATCLATAPFLMFFYYLKYGLPVIWMEQVVSQI